MNELIDQIAELKRLTANIYDKAGDLRDQADCNLEFACNLMRKMTGDLQEVLGNAHDVIYFTHRRDQAGLDRTIKKLEKIDKILHSH